MPAEIQSILALLKSTFKKNAWYGSAVKEVLKDITAEKASYRINNTHSIIELVAHMTAWRIFVIKKLEGDVAYKVSKELNFPKQTYWATVIQELEESQANLITSIEQFNSTRLHESVHNSSSRYTFYTLLHGIIQHDIYHLGQIVLLKKSI